MKPRKDAKLTVRGLGAVGGADAAPGEATAEAPPPAPPSRAVTCVAPRTADERSPGRYSHVPPRRPTRELTRVDPQAPEEQGGTMRPAALPDPES